MISWKTTSLVGVVVCAAVAGAVVAQSRSIVVPADQAFLTVRVPTSDAKVMVGAHQSNQRGTERTFTTPTLTAGYSYWYKIEASWMEGSQKRVAVKEITFKPGESVVVDFRAAVAKPLPVAKNTEEKKPTTKNRTFLFTYAGTVKGLVPGKEASVWLPVAVSGPEQNVTIVTQNLPSKGNIGTEKQYGNSSFFFKAKANDSGEIPFEVAYRVARKEVKADMAANFMLKPSTSENLTRFLQPDAKVPITGKPLDLIKDTKLPKDQFAAAKVLYDVVNTHMKYSKDGKGWGQGDSVWACDSKFGNCSDFHSLFISMARGNKIPSKFEMGFPIPTKHGEGVVGGYHCWAWFLPNQKGWVPVDISEANRNPDMKEYYFGNLTEDRVRFTTGRDINLEPRQKGPALNFFIYPYVEVDGVVHPQEKIDRRFAYKDVQ